MVISERMFQIMDERGMTQAELSRLTGISTRTISDWRKKKTNPGADKIMIICEALGLTPEELLEGKSDYENRESKRQKAGIKADAVAEAHLIEVYRNLPENMRRRLLAYMAMLENTKGE